MEKATPKKSAGFYIGMVSAILALVSGIALLIYSNAVSDVYVLPPILLMIGALIAVLGLLKGIHFLAIIPGACYLSAVGLYVSSELENISGRVSGNGLGITGTTLNMLFTFLALMLAATLLAIVASFMRQHKQTA